MKKKSSMQKRRERYFGIVKLPQGVKMSWISKQDMNGWSLGLGLNSRTVWLRGLRFKSSEEVRRCAGGFSKTSLVFLPLKGNLM